MYTELDEPACPFQVLSLGARALAEAHDETVQLVCSLLVELLDQEGAIHSAQVNPNPNPNLPFTRYRHYQYGMACIAINDGRGETLYCAIVWAMKGVGGVPKPGGCLRRIVLYLGQRSRTERISCKGLTRRRDGAAGLLAAGRAARSGRSHSLGAGGTRGLAFTRYPKIASAALETDVLLLYKAGRTAAMRALCQRNQRL